MNAYDVITDRIIALLAAGTVPWRKPWAGEGAMPTNFHSRRPYRGINTFLLSCAPYVSLYWLTFKQALAAGGAVRKGEKGFPVVFWKWLDRRTGADGDDGEEAAGGRVPMIRYYTVFNVDQCDGLEVPPPPVVAGAPPIARCEEVVTRMPHAPHIQHGGSMAAYRPALDLVSMPDRSHFVGPEEYYSTLFHELGHSTGHATRLNRKGVTDPVRFGSHEYSREELVAEMTAAFLCGHCDIAPATLDNSAAYVGHWLQVLRGDAKLVVQAAASAQKATDHILARVAPVNDDAEAA